MVVFYFFFIKPILKGKFRTYLLNTGGGKRMQDKVSIPLFTIKNNSQSFAIDIINRWLDDKIARIIKQASKSLNHSEIEEIRLRINKPLIIRTHNKELFLTAFGQIGTMQNAYFVTREDVVASLEKMTFSSIYAVENDLRQGFFTLPGGHRVGICGETIVEFGKIKTIRNVSTLNIRLARQPRINVDILKYLIDGDKVFCHTLLISPPRGGKTTILRFLIKQLSDGLPSLGLEGQTIGVVDERSEIAGMWQGIPSFDLGCRTDVLDRCPKSVGLNMLIRSMSPSIIAVDEIGSQEDIDALAEAARCGVKILATVHANSLEELKKRESLRNVLNNRLFERAVVLSRARGPGTIEAIYNLTEGVMLTSGTMK